MLYPRLSLCREERMTRCATSQRLRAIVAKRAGMLSVMSPNGQVRSQKKDAHETPVRGFPVMSGARGKLCSKGRDIQQKGKKVKHGFVKGVGRRKLVDELCYRKAGMLWTNLFTRAGRPLFPKARS